MTQTRTKFDVLRELREVDEQLQERAEGFLPPVGALPSTELMKRKALLRHELKKFDTITATGDTAEAIKAHHRRIIEEERKLQEEQERIEKERIKEAKKQIKKEMSTDTSKLLEIIDSLPKEKQRDILAKLNDKNKK